MRLNFLRDRVLRNVPTEGATGAPAGESSAPAPALSTLLSTGAPPATGDTGAEGASQTDQRGSAPLPPQAGEGTEGSGAPEGGIAGADGVPLDPAKLTLPEGVTLGSFDNETLEAFSGAINDPKLTPQERGQKLFDLYTAAQQKTTQAVEAAALEQWTQMNDQWRQAVNELPEFKGKVQQELGAMKQALTTLGAGEEFFRALDLTGAGNNPHILQLLHKLTAPHREGAATSGGSAARPATRDRAASFYPTMQQKG